MNVGDKETFTPTSTGRSGDIQNWTAPILGIYKITAKGAKGDPAGNNNYGKGAKISGEFEIKEGEELEILVGQVPPDNDRGGGGGSFVTKSGVFDSGSGDDSDIYVIAGGGAGYTMDSGISESEYEGREETSGGTSDGVTRQDNGDGGILQDNDNTGAGGGFLGDGEGSGGGDAYVNGALGGNGSDAEGGFGGGGGRNGGWGTGAGGGYTGGNGGEGDDEEYCWAGGGGSYNNGDNQVNESGVNDDEGEVEIELLKKKLASTNEATNIQSNSAQLNGTLNSLEGESSLDVYFEWGEDDSYGNTTDTQTLSDTGDFDDTISGLSAETEYHYRAVATDGTNTWYGDDVAFTTQYTPDDFSKFKRLNVRDVSGTPTIERTVPIKIVGGDDSTTGTGDIVLDWTNISSKSDIAVYDENNNLFDYYFESFDASNEKAVIHVYDSFVRDGTEQVKIAYGDGPSDQSVSASTVFDKESNLDGGWLLNESSGDALDVTSNNNDGTLNGGVTQGEDGIVDGAYDFDGSDGYIDIPHDSSIDIGTENITVLAWFKTNSFKDNSRIWNKGGKSRYEIFYYGDDDEIKFALDDDSNKIEAEFDASSSGPVGDLDDGNWHLLIAQRDYGNQAKIKVDDSDWQTASDDTGDISNTEDAQIGTNEYYDTSYWNGLIDNIMVLSSLLSDDEITALYDSTKSSPDFFSQQAGEEQATVIEAPSMSALLEIASPIVSYGSTIESGLTSNISLPAPTIQHGTTITAQQLSAILEIPVPEIISGSTTITAPPITALGEIQIPNLSYGYTIGAEQVTGQVVIQIPVITYGVSIQGTVRGILEIPVPTPSYGSTIETPTQYATLTIPDPSVAYGTTITSENIAAQALIPIPSLSYGFSINVEPLKGELYIVTPKILIDGVEAIWTKEPRLTDTGIWTKEAQPTDTDIWTKNTPPSDDIWTKL